MGRESNARYTAMAPLVGALITLMSGVNSQLSSIVGNVVATLVIHVAGLAAVSAILLFKREPVRPGRLPLSSYLGGFFGVGTVFSTIYSFTVLGASLAVALALLGQTLFSVLVDGTGFMGRTKYPLTTRRLPGIALAFAGVALIAAGAQVNAHWGAPAMLIALVSGMLPGLTFILNSELGRKKGVLRSTRVNYVTGLATTLIIVAVIRPPAAEAVRAVAAAGPLLALGGGFMGVGVVTSMNVIFPRLSAFSAALLVFSGQAFAGVIMDAAAKGSFDLAKLFGTVVVLFGLALNGFLTSRGKAIRSSEEPV